MKSKIAWDNHIMRKYGDSIRKKIAEIGVKQNINIRAYQAVQRLKPVWGSKTPGRC